MLQGVHNAAGRFQGHQRAPMADIVKLRYDDFYYNHEQKAMRFIRQKTMRNLP